MTLPDSAKPRNKRLSFYKFVVENLSEDVPVIVEGCSDLFNGWLTPRGTEGLSSWIELHIESFSGGLNSKMKVRFDVNVRDSRDEDSFQMKRMDDLLERIMSLLNTSGGDVIPVYDFSDPANPERIGEEQGLGFIPRHTPEEDGFAAGDVPISRYRLHYELWLWQEGVAP
ncbi:MAG: hypothetical protein JW941_00415 [Candidatus Coatesbacteria bacterium]|nr:hypothetical protein [Candidatus Coatesbacteria bacterium]